MARAKNDWPPQNSLGLRVASGAVGTAGTASTAVARALRCGLMSTEAAGGNKRRTADAPEAAAAWLGGTAATRSGSRGEATNAAVDAATAGGTAAAG